jgi:uncharacterized membrane protein
MKQALAAALALLGLTACQPQGPDGKPAPPPAAAPAVNGPLAVSDFSRPMTARGTEPFWALSIDGTHFKLSRPDHPDVLAEAPGATIQPGQATWTAKAADGQAIKVTFYVSECSDGMSELRYPMTAEVTLTRESLRGCAAKTADLPAPKP